TQGLAQAIEERKQAVTAAVADGQRALEEAVSAQRAEGEQALEAAIGRERGEQRAAIEALRVEHASPFGGLRAERAADVEGAARRLADRERSLVREREAAVQRLGDEKDAARAELERELRGKIDAATVELEQTRERLEATEDELTRRIEERDRVSSDLKSKIGD